MYSLYSNTQVIHSKYSNSLTASPSSSSNNMLVWNTGSTLAPLSVTTGFKNSTSFSSSSNPHLTLHNLE